MATKKTADPAPEAQEGEESGRAVDPPEATPDEVTDAESSTEQQWVIIDQSGSLTLPSGASYLFNPGSVMHLSAEDAAFVVAEGYGSETDDPSGE